jgi:hypothetical protein
MPGVQYPVGEEKAQRAVFGHQALELGSQDAQAVVPGADFRSLEKNQTR